MPNAGAAAPANPYPSVINVAGLPGKVTDANVTIRSFNHACLSDADILLTGPGGARGLLLSDAGGYCSPAAVGVTIALDDEATTTYPCNASPSGTFKPTNDPVTAGNCVPTPDAFPPPAPPGPHPVTLSGFDGTSPNGAWSLFVFDEAGGSAGSITGGWSLELASGSCADRPATVPTLVGTAADDVLTGTTGPDVILGLGGNDRILGLEGEDRLCGGDGKDKLLGGTGKDKLIGQGGKDSLKGGGGKDLCKGGKGKDSASACEKKRGI
jgi:Ca2+-binding RTX toxin-like protein